MSTYEISKSSLLSLKAEILRKQQELVKAKADNEIKIKIIKKNTPLEIKNKGIEARLRNDITEEEENLLKLSKSALEAKSKLYDRLSSGKLTRDELERKKRFLVRFDKKNPDQPIDFEDSEPEEYPESDQEYYHSDEETANKDPGEKWVDYTDCLGRTRKCLQKDLQYIKAKDEDLRKTVEAKNKTTPSAEQTGNSVDEKRNDDDEKKNSLDPGDSKSEISNEESELLSNDMRRELLRKQWEKEEEELRNKSNIHYQDILFGEARTHGVGYYGFSKDEEERSKQQEALKKLRTETEEKQRRAQELKAIREKQLAARIKAAKDRRRARLGLPPEEEEAEPTAAVPEISEEEKKKQKELLKKKEETEKQLERARKKHLRPWDIGKEGVKEHYEMSQEEWVEKKREERPEEFAPPQAYTGRKFRSAFKESQSDDVDRSLKFTTKKSKEKNKTRDDCFSQVYKKDFPQDRDFDPVHENTASDAGPFTPTPIENLCDTADFDDHLLVEHNRAMSGIKNQNSSDGEANNTFTRRGVEVAPPPTFDYYGPSGSKKPKFTKQTVDIENSIEQGLKFLRKQVEERQTTARQRSNMVAQKKQKKAIESINSRLALVMKSGKYCLGYKQTLKTLRQGKAKLIIISNNTPPLRRSEIEYYAMLAKTGVHHYTGNNVELGTACGKYFRVCAMSITDPGDSDIIRSMPAGDGGPQ
ncbi:hypothetical protein NQ315_008437 [Exocentrus adspersus]|uniref:Large ribosomal subunit protein eL30 n=1 Tax=Exocentrus adspersus TaxID=1586481 RepID=A0AAV8W5T0_9CUCU|nr:hypothetical protein NQ315_008437 [Exocentrus adspersus]